MYSANYVSLIRFFKKITNLEELVRKTTTQEFKARRNYDFISIFLKK